MESLGTGLRLRLAGRAGQKLDRQADFARPGNGAESVDQLHLFHRPRKPSGHCDSVVWTIAFGRRAGQRQRPAIGLLCQHGIHRVDRQRRRFEGDLGLAFQSAGQADAKGRGYRFIGRLIAGQAGDRSLIA